VKAINIRLEDQTHGKLYLSARRDKRSLQKQVIWILENYFVQAEHLYDLRMEEEVRSWMKENHLVGKDSV